MSLFQTGMFQLASGQHTSWKIDCDALTNDDWGALAYMASQILPPFYKVYGVPTGGNKFAEALRRYQSLVQVAPLVLIAEDVVTTGGSITHYRSEVLEVNPGLTRSQIIGVAAFFRSYKASVDASLRWVQPLFIFPYSEPIYDQNR